MDFIFNTIPQEIVPFDYSTFYNSEQRNWVVATDCKSGEAVYYESKQLKEEFLRVLSASSSLPFIAKPVKYDGRVLMDGGLTDSIPVGKSIEHGNTRNVIILTQPRGYRKSRSNVYKLANFRYPGYRGLGEALKNRWQVYNKTVDLVEELEDQGRLFVIRPEFDLHISRVERNQEKLFACYDYGYKRMKDLYHVMLDYLDAPVVKGNSNSQGSPVLNNHPGYCNSEKQNHLQ